ncbi:hypothetical protein [Scytonema sp. NUACC26]|uniref:hypothetical protein n=1 Tax=Scytonema sp. NUACC26 TaxID=3140176 RepID=UPI0038B36814
MMLSSKCKGFASQRMMAPSLPDLINIRPSGSILRVMVQWLTYRLCMVFGWVEYI